ncbi:aminoglycoside phosphotransferase family protein [bacterium]|nr:aminoglycoside phosphotransferase family protein [bacterium]
MIDNYIARFSKLKSSNYEFEKKVLDYIRDKVPVPTPRIEIVYDGPYVYSLHKSLPGAQWDPHDVLNTWDPKKRMNLIQDFADFLVALHAIDVHQMQASIPELEYFSYTPYPAEYLESIVHKYVTKSEFATFYQKYTQMCQNNRITVPVLLHRDYGGHNCLVDPHGHLCGVIDFNGVRIGQPDMDILRAADHGPFLDAVRKIYESKTGRKIDVERGYQDRFIEYVHAIVRLWESHNSMDMKEQSIKSFVDGTLKRL